MLPEHLPWLCQEADGTMRTAGEKPLVLLSGSFNPLHEGHRHLAQIAGERLGRSVAFELSMVNVDKPEISAHEVRRRIQQFISLAPIYVTRASVFEKKAALFPGSVMVVGADTAIRILDPRYYGNDPAERDRSLANIRRHNCRFLVAGRIDAQGVFVGIGGLQIPEGLRDLFEGLGEAEFRVDLSSTLLRARSVPS